MSRVNANIAKFGQLPSHWQAQVTLEGAGPHRRYNKFGRDPKLGIGSLDWVWSWIGELGTVLFEWCKLYKAELAFGAGRATHGCHQFLFCNTSQFSSYVQLEKCPQIIKEKDMVIHYSNLTIGKELCTIETGSPRRLCVK